MISLYSKDKADSVESFIECMFYTDPQLQYQKSVNQIIKTYISGVVSYGGGATDQDFHLSVEYIKEAISKFGDEYNRQLDLVEDGGIWTTETSISISESKLDYVEVSLSNWNYEGGAHGSAWSEQRLIDRETGQELKLADFITDYSELTSIAEVIFRADQGMDADQSLQAADFWFEDDKFLLNENFVFNENSLDFFYNQYEIAPYAAGMISLSIPMEKIQHLLKRKAY